MRIYRGVSQGVELRVQFLPCCAVAPVTYADITPYVGDWDEWVRTHIDDLFVCVAYDIEGNSATIYIEDAKLNILGEGMIKIHTQYKVGNEYFNAPPMDTPYFLKVGPDGAKNYQFTIRDVEAAKSQGIEEGLQQAKDLMIETYITGNGVYERELGYKKVVVDVKKTDVELEERTHEVSAIDIAGSTLIPDVGYDGFSKVHINAENFYNQSVQEGRDLQAEADSDRLVDLKVTKVGNYVADYGYKTVDVAVNGGTMSHVVYNNANGAAYILISAKLVVYRGEEFYNQLVRIDMDDTGEYEFDVYTDGNYNITPFDSYGEPFSKGIATIVDHATLNINNVASYEGFTYLSSYEVKGVPQVIYSGGLLANIGNNGYVKLPQSLKLIKSGGVHLSFFGTIDSSPFAPLKVDGKIYVEAMTAPTLEPDALKCDRGGKLYIHRGAEGYDAWLEQLGSGWSIEYMD